METIHLKTIDPISQELLRAAARKGIALNWERSEKLQPQDGFLRIGLSCPYGCLQGPCRIDPFGRGPDRGLCGLDRDGMVAAFFLRLTLQGALESTEAGALEDSTFDRDIKGNPLENPIPVSEIFRSAKMLNRPAASPGQLIRQALRMGILSTRLLENGDAGPPSLACEAGYGVVAENRPVIAVCGNPPFRLLDGLVRSAGREVRIVSLGEWIHCGDRFLPCVCSSGESELALSSGRIDLLLAGPGAEPGVVSVCEAIGIPMILSGPQGADAEEILKRAKRRRCENGQTPFPAEASNGTATVYLSAAALKDAFKGTNGRKIALVGGADSPLGPMGRVPVELAGGLEKNGCPVGAWGDAALWMIKNGFCAGDRLPPVRVLNPRTGPLQAVKALSANGTADRIGGILFTGLKDCRDLSIAVGLAASGVRVCLSTPLPVWGSEAVRRMIEEQTGLCGGNLVHFDHLVQPAELLHWFLEIK